MRSFTRRLRHGFARCRRPSKREQKLRPEDALLEAKRLLWESCESAPGSAAAPLVAFGRVAERAVDAIDSRATLMLHDVRHGDLAASEPFAIDLHDAGGALERLAKLSKRLSEKLRSAGQALGSVPPTTAGEGGVLDGAPFGEAVLRKPATLPAALSDTGMILQAAALRDETITALAREYGTWATGEEPRLIAIGWHRMPPPFHGGEPGEPQLCAAHLRGKGDVWWDILDRQLALPTGTRIFFAAP